MSAGRTVWWAKDSAWWRRERIVELGEEFGADGPAVLDWLSCEAKAQNDGGFVKTGFRSIARGCFVELVTVRHVLSRCVTLSLVEDYEESGNVITCRLSGWRSDQERAKASVRQEKKRLKDADSVVASHALSRSVTDRHAESPTGQDRTEELLPPLPPASGGRQRDHQQFEDVLKQWTAEHFPDAQPNHVGALASWLRGRNVEPTPENMRAYAAEFPQWSPGIVEVAA